MLSHAEKLKVKDFIVKGQKIAAIKYLREQHPLSLKEATDWVNYLGGETPSEPYSTAEPNQSAPLSNVAKEKVKSMVRKGEHIQAIKYLRDEYSLTLSQAKQLTDLASKETGISTGLSFNSSSLAMYIFAFLGTVFLLAASYFWWSDYQITHDSITVVGRVIDLNYDHEDDQSGAIPVIEYAWKGKKKVHRGSTYSNPPAVEIGEEVELFVNRSDPDQVVINLLSERYFLMFILGILGVVFGAIGYIGLFYKVNS